MSISTHFFCHIGGGSARVFGRGYGLQVFRVDTISNPTEVVYVEPVRYRANKFFVHGPVRKENPPT